MAAPLHDDELTRCALAAGRGEPGAAAAFVRATQRDVHRFLTALAGRADAEDLTQETLLRALGALPRFAGRSSARTWLLSIARRTAADHVRAAVRGPRTSEVADWEALGERHAPPTGLDDRLAVREAMGALDPDRRDAFVLTQVLDLSYAEAAQVCGCPVGTIRSRVARARADLVEALDAGTGRRVAGA